MEDFAQFEEQLEAHMRDGDIDLNEEMDSEDESGKPYAEYRYKDFFEVSDKPPASGKKKAELGNESEEEEEENDDDEGLFPEEDEEEDDGESTDDNDLETTDEEIQVSSILKNVRKTAAASNSSEDSEEQSSSKLKKKKSVRFQVEEEDSEEDLFSGKEDQDDSDDGADEAMEISKKKGKKKAELGAKKKSQVESSDDDWDNSDDEDEAVAGKKGGKKLVLGTKDSKRKLDQSSEDEASSKTSKKKKLSSDSNRAKNIFGSQATDSDDSDDSDDSPEHQRVERKFLEMVRQKEEEALQEKSWNMKGEVDATKRDKESMLEDFYNTKRLVRTYELTPEYLAEIHQIILRRCIDDVWDSPVRQVRPSERHFEYRQHKELDQEKSKKSLCAIYEDQFLAQKNLLKVNDDDSDPVKEVKAKMATLFKSLDALSHFHYLSGPLPELPVSKHAPNLPAFTAEEVGPEIVSTVSRDPAAKVADKKRKDLRYMTESSKSLKKRKRKQIGKSIALRESKKSKSA